MLLTESRIFLCRRDTESITASLAARAQKLTGNISALFFFQRRSRDLAFASTKMCLQSGNHDLLQSMECAKVVGLLLLRPNGLPLVESGSPCFVATVVLTVEMMM